MSSFFSRGGGTPTQEPQTSTSETPAPMFPLQPLERLPRADPIAGKPGFYVIDGREVGPDFVFSNGDRLKGRPYLRAKAYVLAESLRLKGGLVCPGSTKDPEHYLTEQTSEVHHQIRKTLHVGRGLGIACHRHNSIWGSPPGSGSSETRERESSSRSDAQPQASSLESAKHDPQRAAWDQAIADSKIWSDLKAQGCFTTEWHGKTWFLLTDLTQIAVKYTEDPVFGKYSSETFARYAGEDRFSVLEMDKIGGRWCVRRREP